MNSVEKRIGDIVVKVDYRTELMGVITWLGKYHKEMPELYSREGNKEYIKEIRKEFKPYAKDEVIKEFDKLVKEFDLYNEDSFEMFLELDNELNPTDETNEQKINNFSLKLKDFSEKIGFDNFFEEHRNEYETYVENVSKIFETIDVSKFMFDYFGYKLNKRIKGIHTVTADEYVNAFRYPDSIARGAHPIDIHVASGPAQNITFLKTPAYVPYRALMAPTHSNLLVAGRCLSADKTAFASLRVQASCMDMGQAAGTAAALAAGENTSVQKVDADALIDRLRAHGSVI